MVAGADGEVSGRPDVKEADANDTDIVLHASAHAHTVPAAVLTSPDASRLSQTVGSKSSKGREL